MAFSIATSQPKLFHTVLHSSLLGNIVKLRQIVLSHFLFLSCWLMSFRKRPSQRDLFQFQHVHLIIFSSSGFKLSPVKSPSNLSNSPPTSLIDGLFSGKGEGHGSTAFLILTAHIFAVILGSLLTPRKSWSGPSRISIGVSVLETYGLRNSILQALTPNENTSAYSRPTLATMNLWSSRFYRTIAGTMCSGFIGLLLTSQDFSFANITDHVLVLVRQFEVVGKIAICD
jgi:hypothetical protein